MTTNFPTTIVASVQPKMWSQVAEQLRTLQGITYFSPLAGRFDLAIELKAAEPSQVYELINKVRSINGITSTRSYTPFEGYNDGKNFQSTDSLALCLVQANQPVGTVLQSMKQLTHVRNAFVVPGEFDILATIYGKNHEEILSQVSKINEVQGVRTSETLFAYKPTWQ
ncbi:MAG: Lrp/AsnC ligand binding domain-containing protein [Nitrososphaerota archaeon]|nr:Lrp/AsnC ligand binding domain-containing protein [Nitrososphaerota archaeon]